MKIPEPTLRLFDGYDPSELENPGHSAFLVERVLEEGDTQDLRWLCESFGEEEVLRIFKEARGLTARSRRFWSLVLDGRLDTAPAAQDDLWPL